MNKIINTSITPSTLKKKIQNAFIFSVVAMNLWIFTICLNVNPINNIYSSKSAIEYILYISAASIPLCPIQSKLKDIVENTTYKKLRIINLILNLFYIAIAILSAFILFKLCFLII